MSGPLERLLTAPNGSLLGRGANLVEQVRERGQFGLLAVDDYPESGRVCVPTVVLSDLLSISIAVRAGEPVT